MVFDFSIPGFPFPVAQLSFGGNLHWTNHFFDSPASERFFSGLLGDENIAPYRPQIGFQVTPALMNGLGIRLRNALTPAVAEGLMVSFDVFDSGGVLHEQRVTVCRGRLALPFRSVDGRVAEVATMFVKADGAAAMRYTLNWVLVPLEVEGQSLQVLPLPSERQPLSGTRPPPGGAIGNVRVHNLDRFGFEAREINGRVRQVFNPQRLNPL